MAADSYAEQSAKWEAQRALVQSLPLVWKPGNPDADKHDSKQTGSMLCEITDMPTGQTAQTLATMIKNHDEVAFEPVVLTSPSGIPVISLDLNRLSDFVNCYAHCYTMQDEKDTPLYKGTKNQLGDFRFSFSKAGHDIYAFCADMRESQHLQRLLVAAGIKPKGVTVIGSQYRVNIARQQEDALQLLGIEIQPYSAKENRALYSAGR